MGFEPLLLLILAFSVLVGLTLGLLGGGGSILMVPLLTYVAGMDAKQAITTSLFVVGVTSLASLAPHARAHNVRWAPGLIFAAASMSGAFLGGLASSMIPGPVLMVAFALIMLASSWNMIRGRRSAPAATHRARSLMLFAPVGLAVGLVTGLVGAGGGFLIVPALALLAGLKMQEAVGTSLLVITLNSAAGMLGHLNSTTINWPLTLSITAAAIIGSLLGARLTAKIPEKKLRRGFGYFVLVMGLIVLMQELPAPANLLLPTAAIAAGGGWFFGQRRPGAKPSNSY
ncbi:sulfite exporter TauE/SafE family protein [Glutamicibacter sp.]|uniref:sulfite exporter TauE/SafE family protein n=1 Tax=Glutamicibacter sp. TaxID=1931995 RepID=UPI0028BEDE63|nr:sulfite exporter TauE/SafE family protein [Glutamicibacter sp.]